MKQRSAGLRRSGPLPVLAVAMALAIPVGGCAGGAAHEPAVPAARTDQALITRTDQALMNRTDPASTVRTAPAPATYTAPPPAAQPDRFFDPQAFDLGFRAATAEALPPAPAGRLAGGVVPHHTLAGANLSRFFLRLGAQPPQTLIVVGPNHPERGQRIITGRRGWATAFGTVAAEDSLVDALVGAGLATIDEETLSAEHSVGALMPYLKYHAPMTRVVPLILHKDITRAELERLADALAPAVREGRTLVASVDFSHYLPRRQAETKDAETWAAIAAGDLPGLLRMGPDHLDSPPALVLVMLTMQRLDAAGPVVEAHTNSGVILKNDQIETTSYFTLSYWMD